MRLPKNFRWMLVFVGIIALFLLSCSSGEKEEVEIKLMTKVEHQPITEHVGDLPLFVKISIEANYPVTGDIAQVFFRILTEKDTTEWQSRPFVHVKADSFAVELPLHDPGVWLDYYCEVKTLAGDPIKLPKAAPDEFYSIQYKGDVANWIWALHMFFSYLTLIMVGLAAFYAYGIIARGFILKHCVWFYFGGFVSFLLGAFVFGILVNIGAYGVFWQGFPFGTDGTETFSLFLLLYWIFVLTSVKDILLRKPVPKTWFVGKIVGYLVLVGAAFYLFVTIFAHNF